MTLRMKISIWLVYLFDGWLVDWFKAEMKAEAPTISGKRYRQSWWWCLCMPLACSYQSGLSVAMPAPHSPLTFARSLSLV